MHWHSGYVKIKINLKDSIILQKAITFIFSEDTVKRKFELDLDI